MATFTEGRPVESRSTVTGPFAACPGAGATMADTDWMPVIHVYGGSAFVA